MRVRAETSAQQIQSPPRVKVRSKGLDTRMMRMPVSPHHLFHTFVFVPVHLFLCGQLTPEMYDTNQHGDVYYEVFLRFVEDLLDKWREMDVTHHLTVVFFCRVYYAGNKVNVNLPWCKV